MNLDTQISQTPSTEPRPAPPGSVVPLPGRSIQLEEYQKAKLAYEELAAKYTPKYPEVKEAKARMERLKEQVSADGINGAIAGAGIDAKTASNGEQPNPVYQKLAAQLQEVKTELGIREREKKAN